MHLRAASGAQNNDRVFLVVDDEVSVRVTLEYVLQKLGYRVVLAEGAADALRKTGSEPVDGALIDFNMPEANGIECYIRLRDHPTALRRPLRVWLMTGAPRKEICDRATALGVMTVLQKPFDIPDLCERIETEFDSDRLSS